MKQNLILALFAFLVAVAGATWFSIFIAPERPIVVADSLAATAVPRGGAAPGDSAPVAPVAAALLTAADSVLPQAAQPAAAEPAADPRGAKEVAKILITMKPKAAAEIMAKLTDDEVERIVRQLNAKQVAVLLGSLPQDRAAALSRRLLTPTTATRGGT